jgi:hypothetical protein
MITSTSGQFPTQAGSSHRASTMADGGIQKDSRLSMVFQKEHFDARWNSEVV